MKVFLFDLFQFFPSLGMAVGMICLSQPLIHYFQLESYQFYGYAKTLRRQWKRICLPLLYAFVACCVLLAIHSFIQRNVLRADVFSPEYASMAAQLPYDGCGLLFGVLCALSLMAISSAFHARGTKEKKPLVITSRVKRLAVSLIIVVLLVLLILQIISPVTFCFFGLPQSAMILLLPFLLFLAALLVLPVEKFIFYLYFSDARRRLLKNEKLIRIGITGSYGKTSVKFILQTILSQKYRVLTTPSSYNTPMGLTKVIRERLEVSHQVFIGEMGARHVGEIKQLCQLVHPTIGILTSIGPQHLDTFKTYERIVSTKNELIEALPADGYAVFTDDAASVKELYDACDKQKALVGSEGSDAWASNGSISQQGSTFILHIPDSEPFECTTVLLGAHNIQNILLCAVVAHHMGLSNAQIARGIAQLKPIEHRLQLMKTGFGVTIIDDAFNTNPRSSKLALDVLKDFEGRRIIVTPGMVELGEKEDDYNRTFGREIAKAADMAFLIGKKHTDPILQGLLGENFPHDSIYSVDSLDEATALLNGMMRPGDVVLYENDLPDHYDEK